MSSTTDDTVERGRKPKTTLRVCPNLFRPGWNGWNGTRLFVVVRSIPTCFQVFVSIPTTKRIRSNSFELSANGNILDCQYKTLGTIVTHKLQVGCLDNTHAPLLFPFSRHDYSAPKRVDARPIQYTRKL